MSQAPVSEKYNPRDPFGWEALMDYLVATELPKMMARPLDTDVITRR